jgi:hypothetical protein
MDKAKEQMEKGCMRSCGGWKTSSDNSSPYVLLRKQQVATLKDGQFSYSSSIHQQQCASPSHQGKIVSHNSKIDECTLAFPSE